MMTDMLTAYQAHMLSELRDAKSIRDAGGWPNTHADALLTRLESGDWSGYADPTGDDFGVVHELGARREAGGKAGNQYGTFQVKFASVAQTSYISALLTRKDLSGLGTRAAELVARAMPHIEAGKINKRHASDVLDVLIPLADLVTTAPRETTRRSNRYGGKCLRCGVYVAAEAGYLTKDDAGKWASEHAGECPTVAPTAAAVPAYEWSVEDSGIYRDPTSDSIFKVYRNRAGTRMLAKRLEVSVSDDGDVSGSFEYAGMASRFVQPAWRMSLDEAKTYGTIYGVCVNCGATLTDETSIAAGIGPVCAKRFA